MFTGVHIYKVHKRSQIFKKCTQIVCVQPHIYESDTNASHERLGSTLSACYSWAKKYDNNLGPTNIYVLYVCKYTPCNFMYTVKKILIQQQL